jgi:hypothetical protein
MEFPEMVDILDHGVDAVNEQVDVIKTSPR